MTVKGYKGFRSDFTCQGKQYEENTTYEEDGKAKAKKGSWITLTEWVLTSNKNNDVFPKCVKTEYVDGERIKEDTFYELVDGEFKEC